ncbi:MAG: glycosyltransferase family 2 protein [Desulfobacteraceae bacterium]|nr:MAG: glycosyltransferase family 2 protein [Desulfobacteraceae bacterium]
MNPTPDPEKRLALCMIVKNEAELLGPCLESIRELADEMIVIDTGSQDATVALAEQYGARVFPHQWQNDFSLARNLSLEQASSDWILFLDADERIDPASLPLLKEILNDPDAAEGYRLQFINYIGDGSAPIQSPLLRLFQNRGYRFTGKIHEQIETTIAAHGPIRDAPVIVHHFGYLPKIQAEKNKGNRNITLLQTELQAAPHDSYLRFQLGRSLGIAGRHAEAVREFEQIWDHYEKTDPKAWPAYAVHAIYLMSKSYRLLGRFEPAAQWSQWALRHWSTAELFFQHGVNQQSLHRYAEAIGAFTGCLRAKKDERFVFQTQVGMESFLTMLQLGKIYEFCGDAETARAWYAEAFQHSPDHPDSVYRLVRLTPDPESLGSFLRSITSPNALEAFCFGCAEIGYPATPALLDRLEKKGVTRSTRNARLRYLGRHGDRNEWTRLLQNDPDEYARFIECLVLLNEQDMPAFRKKAQGLQKYRAQAEAVQAVLDNRPGRPQAGLVLPLCIDFSLQYVFDSILLSFSPEHQDEALLEAQKAWKQGYDFARSPGNCGVACDLRTARALDRQDPLQARFWLEKAEEHGHTITRCLHRLRWERLAGDAEKYKIVLENALKEFPESLLLQKTAGAQ